MTGALNAYGGWTPGLTHPDPVLLTSSRGAGSGTANPNTLTLPTGVFEYVQFDANGNWLATWYKNPSTGVWA